MPATGMTAYAAIIAKVIREEREKLLAMIAALEARVAELEDQVTRP